MNLCEREIPTHDTAIQAGPWTKGVLESTLERSAKASSHEIRFGTDIVLTVPLQDGHRKHTDCLHTRR